jgi:hypothetical protein
MRSNSPFTTRHAAEPASGFGVEAQVPSSIPLPLGTGLFQPEIDGPKVEAIGQLGGVPDGHRFRTIDSGSPRHLGLDGLQAVGDPEERLPPATELLGGGRRSLGEENARGFGNDVMGVGQALRRQLLHEGGDALLQVVDLFDRAEDLREQPIEPPAVVPARLAGLGPARDAGLPRGRGKEEPGHGVAEAAGEGDDLVGGEPRLRPGSIDRSACEKVAFDQVVPRKGSRRRPASSWLQPRVSRARARL